MAKKYGIANTGQGDDLEITASAVINKTTTKESPGLALRESRQAIIDAGGLIPYTRNRLLGKTGMNFASRWERAVGNLTARTIV